MENQSPRSHNQIKQFYQDSVQILTEPVAFFKVRFEEMSLNHSLVFGLVISWIAAFCDWITRAAKHESLMDGFVKIKDQLHSLPIWKDLPADIWSQGEQMNSFLPSWGLEGLRMLVNPFHSLFSFFIYGVIFWLGTSLLVSKDNPTKKSATITNVIKIVAISSAANIIGAVLGFLPLALGSLMGWIYHTALLMIGFSERFQISRLRGLGIVFLPTIASILVFSCLIGVVVAIFAGVVTSLFH